MLSDALTSMRAVPDSRTSALSGCDRKTRRFVCAPSGLLMYAVSPVELLPTNDSVPAPPPPPEPPSVPGAAWFVPRRNTLTAAVLGTGHSA